MFKRLRFRISIKLNQNEGVLYTLMSVYKLPNVAVADQVHVTKFSNSNQRGVHHVVSRALIFKSDQIFTIVISTAQNWCQIDSN